MQCEYLHLFLVPIASYAVPAPPVLNSTTGVEFISVFLHAEAYGYLFLRSASLISQSPSHQGEALGPCRDSK